MFEIWTFNTSYLGIFKNMLILNVGYCPPQRYHTSRYAIDADMLITTKSVAAMMILMKLSLSRIVFFCFN